MGECKVVRVARDNSDGLGDYTHVDERKFDPKTMKLWQDPSEKKPAKKKKIAKKKQAKKG